MATEQEIEKAREKVDKQYADLVKDLADVWLRVDAVKTAGPTDEIHDLLEDLEKTVHKVRTGGIIGSGAKGHRKALEDWRKVTGQTT